MIDRLPKTDPVGARSLRVVHLFPDLLSVYGDTGNLRTLAVRAARRGIISELQVVVAGADDLPAADIYVIGGGQDRDQVEVERTLRRLGDQLQREIADGAALLAVCGGYQSLGNDYRTADGLLMRGPGILDVSTVGSRERLVGPVIAHLADPIFGDGPTTLVGFENHSGRSRLGPTARPLAIVEIGHGNNDADRTEGLLALPGDGGLLGLRIGTYLHGPLLPRNPHVADALLSAGLRRTGQPGVLEATEDTDEWRAHDHYVERLRGTGWTSRLPGRVRRAIEPARGLIGF